MNERERLIELINRVLDCDKAGIVPEWLADDLLANGVIVPPCKVGDTVYRISKRYGEWCVLPRMVSSMTYSLDHLYRVVWCIHTTADDYLGKTVFLTREEAKAALKEEGEE